MPRFFPRLPLSLAALLLAASALAGCSMMGMGDLSSEKKQSDIAAAKAAASAKAQLPQTVANDVDGNLRQAMLLRQAGSYDEAIRILSQLTLVNADNPRVVAEYGKALAQKGRAQDAIQFLNRAIELSPNDWTFYSALGVSYDQLDDQAKARLAYEHALALRPGEATVLSNYALSRMLAKDPDAARMLIAQAQAASGGDTNPMIARNVALIAGMAPVEADKTAAAKPSATASAVKSTLATATPSEPVVKAAASAPAPKPAPAKVAAAPVAPPIAVTEMPAPPAPQDAAPAGPKNASDVSRLLASQNPVADTAPRPLVPQMAALPAQPDFQAPPGVVMQAVPYDPLAGPVVKLKKPQPKLAARSAPQKSGKNDTAKTADAGAPKTGDHPMDGRKPAPVKAAKADTVPTLRMAADKY